VTQGCEKGHYRALLLGVAFSLVSLAGCQWGPSNKDQVAALQRQVGDLQARVGELERELEEVKDLAEQTKTDVEDLDAEVGAATGNRYPARVLRKKAAAAPKEKAR
jgi:hypothetical protein